MSKRITFTDREIEVIIRGLETLQKETSLDYEVIRVGRITMQDIVHKLSPVEPQEDKMFKKHHPGYEFPDPQPNQEKESNCFYTRYSNNQSLLCY